MTIAVDAMGGDFAPAHVVIGTLDALRESHGRFDVLLVGQQERIEEELRKARAAGYNTAEHCTVVHAPEVVDMHDAPTAALKGKRNSSISIGLDLHRAGKADAFVSAGNTGAVLSAATLILGRLKDVGRPGIGALIPTATSHALLIDAGANVDSRPAHLAAFGVMGSIYMSAMQGVARPKVGLLNVGEEESKGNEASLEAYRMLKQSPLNFIGNIEGRDVLKGEADVIVCDGFVGNILLKFGESVPSFLKSRFTRLAAGSLLKKLIALAARNSLRGVMKDLDYQEHGGAPLLGVNGITMIGHGGSTPKAIKNLIFRAEEMAQRGVHRQIEEALLAFGRTKATANTPGTTGTHT